MLPNEFQEHIVKIIFMIFATCLICMRVSRAGLHHNLKNQKIGRNVQRTVFKSNLF